MYKSNANSHLEYTHTSISRFTLYKTYSNINLSGCSWVCICKPWGTETRMTTCKKAHALSWEHETGVQALATNYAEILNVSSKAFLNSCDILGQHHRYGGNTKINHVFCVVEGNEGVVRRFWILCKSTSGGTVGNHTSLQLLFSLLHTTTTTDGTVPTALQKWLEQA